MRKTGIYHHIRLLFVTIDNVSGETNSRFVISAKNWVGQFVFQLLPATFIFPPKSRTPPQASAEKWKPSKLGFIHSFFYCYMYPTFAEWSYLVSQIQHHFSWISKFRWNLRGVRLLGGKMKVARTTVVKRCMGRLSFSCWFQIWCCFELSRCLLLPKMVNSGGKSQFWASVSLLRWNKLSEE